MVSSDFAFNLDTELLLCDLSTVPTNIPSLIPGIKRQSSAQQMDNDDDTDLDVPDGGSELEQQPVQSAEFQSVIRLLEEGEQVFT